MTLRISPSLSVAIDARWHTYGIVFLGHQVGSFIGVWLGGWLYDRSGSYDLVWWLGAALGVMAAILHWLMRERPVKRLAAENL